MDHEGAREPRGSRVHTNVNTEYGVGSENEPEAIGQERLATE